jgi:diguanylate cyclase (GGDEF)-like protein
LISIRREIDESGQLASCFAALLKVFLELATALPKVALPADSELSVHCEQKLERATALLKGRPPVELIKAAGDVALKQMDQICRSNLAAFEERDAAVKDVVAMVAKAISGFKGASERQKSTLSSLADGFDALSRVEDVTELRRRLRDDVHLLRQTVEEMRRDSEDSARGFEAEISAFQQRLEMARKDSGIDQLTGLSSRRAAELHMQKIAPGERPITLLLFDIEGFRKINEQQGALFGDKLLRALTHVLRTKFPEEAALFRWGADEFLVIVEGPPAMAADHGKKVCWAFASGKYFAANAGTKVALSASVAFAVHEYIRGESLGQSYRHVREALERSSIRARS